MRDKEVRDAIHPGKSVYRKRGMVTITHLIGTMIFCISATAAQWACAQDFPRKPIRFVTFSAGGGLDVSARLIAQGMTANSGWQVIVENKGGGGGVIAALTVARAEPDGYTMLVYGASFWVLPLLREKSPYDAVKDFTPITIAVTSPNIFVVNPSVPVKSLKELIVLAKAKPGVLNYGSSGPGSASHLWAEQFKALAGVDIVHVPYSGAGPALNALIAGQIQFAIVTPGGMQPHVASGRLRALAVGSARPSTLFPDLPTAASSGVPGFESIQITGVFAPAKTPSTVIVRLNEEIRKALQRPEVKEKFMNIGVEVVGSSPQQLAAAVQSETEKLGKLIKGLGIREE